MWEYSSRHLLFSTLLVSTWTPKQQCLACRHFTVRFGDVQFDQSRKCRSGESRWQTLNYRAFAYGEKSPSPGQGPQLCRFSAAGMTVSPRTPMAGGRKAPRHEIAGWERRWCHTYGDFAAGSGVDVVERGGNVDKFCQAACA